MYAIRADVANDDEVRAAVEDAANHLGGLDIVVNNAGIGSQGTVADNSSQEWRDVLEVNVLGIVRVSREALSHLHASEHASIVNMCSIAATAGLPDRALYSASKGAVLALTRAMAADHVRDGLRVNCVNPGTVETPWVERLLAAASRIPRPSAARCERASRSAGLWRPTRSPRRSPTSRPPAASAITGTALAVDGGMFGLRLRPPETRPA